MSEREAKIVGEKNVGPFTLVYCSSGKGAPDGLEEGARYVIETQGLTGPEKVYVLQNGNGLKNNGGFAVKPVCVVEVTDD